MTAYENTEAARNRRARLEQGYRRLGTRQPRCSKCLETDPAALTGVYPNIVCYECSGHPIEGDHFAGRANSDLVAPLLTNDHRRKSDLQADWPTETLRNPEASPLIRAAATIRAWLDFLRIIIDRAVGWIPEALEWLNQLLTEHIGARWWDILGYHPT